MDHHLHCRCHFHHRYHHHHHLSDLSKVNLWVMLFSSTLFKSHVLCNFTICLLPLLHSKSLSVSLLPSFVKHITLQSSYKIITDFPCACPNHLQNPFIYLFCNGTHSFSHAPILNCFLPCNFTHLSGLCISSVCSSASYIFFIAQHSASYNKQVCHHLMEIPFQLGCSIIKQLTTSFSPLRRSNKWYAT